MYEISKIHPSYRDIRVYRPCSLIVADSVHIVGIQAITLTFKFTEIPEKVQQIIFRINIGTRKGFRPITYHLVFCEIENKTYCEKRISWSFYFKSTYMT